LVEGKQRRIEKEGDTVGRIGGTQSGEGEEELGTVSKRRGKQILTVKSLTY